jgi:ketosteroid isomerase-like protein
MDNTEIARRLFEALAAQDDATVRSLCDPDLRVQQNGGKVISLAGLLRFNAAVGSVVSGFRYEDAVRSATPGGFVEEHAVRGMLPDGTAVDLAVCVVVDIKDGKVTSLREYLDSAAAAGLRAALSSR